MNPPRQTTPTPRRPSARKPTRPPRPSQFPKPDPLALAVRAHMRAAGVSVEDLAARTGIDSANLSNWFTGRRGINLRTALNVLAELNLLAPVVALVRKPLR